MGLLSHKTSFQYDYMTKICLTTKWTTKIIFFWKWCLLMSHPGYKLADMAEGDHPGMMRVNLSVDEFNPPMT